MTWTMEWINQQVELYQNQERAHYEAYAELLKSLLRRACEMHAPMAQVQSRAKMPASFAEKCIRKYPQYEEPVFELTDLCGARVITHSQIEADKVCHFIRSQFTIDEANSEDTKERLQTSEFGYRSVHFVVQVPQDIINSLSLSREEEIWLKKADETAPGIAGRRH